MDNTILLGIVAVVLVVVAVGAVFWMKKANSADDVKRIEPKAQERTKGNNASASNKVKANTAKTAQLEALRDRLSDGKSGPTTAPAKKIVAKKPAETGSGSVSVKSAPVNTSVSNTGQQEESWTPDVEEHSSGASSVNKFLMQQEPNAQGHASNLAKNDILGTVPEIAPIKESESVGSKTVIGSASGGQAATVVMGSVKSGKPLILLVDDSKVIRVKTEKLLSAAGYEVALAIDGMDALSKLGSIRPQVIITDIEMPNLDGFGLVRSVKGNLQTSEIPIIVMTSHVNLHLDIAATEGINGFLPKPFNDQDLLDQVSYLVNG